MKIWKNTWRYYHFTHVYHTWQSYDVWFLRYGVWLTQLFIILDHFLHLYPPNNPENQNFEKMKKNAWRYHHFTHEYHKWQSCMVLEIWSVMDTIFCNFGPFFALLPPWEPKKSKFWKNEKSTWRYYHFTLVYLIWQSYDVWFLTYGAWWTQFFVILDHFLPYYPPNNLKNQNFEKMRTIPGDITILYMCTINDNNMMYSSGNIEHDEHNSLSF